MILIDGLEYSQYSYIGKKNTTFSGTDTLAFIILPKTPPIVLGSLTTFSYSTYRAKKPVPTLGSVLSRGVAKGGRVIAGTMIFTIMSQSWIEELIASVPWLKDACDGTVYSDELPLFDILIISANEYGNHVHMKIQGVNITDEAGTLSVFDAYCENSFSFIAREIRSFNDKKITSNEILYSSNKLFKNFKFDTFNEGFIKDHNNSEVKWNEGYEESIKNALVSLSKVEFDAIVNMIIDLGFEIDAIFNNNIAISNAIFLIMNNFYSYGEIDVKDFINNKLPYIDKEFISDNKSHTSGKDKVITYYSTPDLTDNISYDNANSKVNVFSQTVNDKNIQIYYTDKGFVEKNSIVIYDKDIDNSNNNSPGISNVAATVNIGDTILTNNDKFVNWDGDYKDFFDNFLINLDFGDDYFECISNLMMKNDNGIKNTVKSFFATANYKVDFKDREEEVLKWKPKSCVAIIKELSRDRYFTITINFTKKDDVDEL